MRLNPPNSRRRDDNIVPMINVVFLLLIFFLMTAQITPPAPTKIVAPAAQSDTTATPEARLYISAQGDIYYMGETGKAAMDTLRAAVSVAETAPVVIHADRDLDATSLVRIITQINADGARDISLVLSKSTEGK
jgi:biopolymer transport protein ExbD